MVTDLLIVTPGFPANEEDSTCIPPLQAYLLALRKARPELNIAVIATQYPHTATSYTWNGITVLPCDGRNRNWLKPLTWLRARIRANGLRTKGSITAIHSLWLGEAALLGQQMARNVGARHVITLMGQDAKDGRFWWNRLSRGSVTVAISDVQKHIHERTFGEQVLDVIPWGIPPMGSANGAAGRKTDLLFCGSLIDVKRPLMFVEVVERIRAQHPVSAMMIGDGALRSQVEQAIATKGLHGSITMCGVLPHDQVLKKMRDASVLVHTSRYEGQGYVFDEAFACGMAIASTPVGSALAYRTGMYPMDRWLIAEQSDGLAIHALDLLRAPTGAPFILHPIADTVAAYLALYGLR